MKPIMNEDAKIVLFYLNRLANLSQSGSVDLNYEDVRQVLNAYSRVIDLEIAVPDRHKERL